MVPDQKAPLLGRSRSLVRRGRTIVTGVVSLLGVLLVSSLAMDALWAPTALWEAAAGDDAMPSAAELQGFTACGTTSGSEVECVLDPRAFLAFENVRAEFARRSVSPEEALALYLPARVVTRYDPGLVGPNFEAGYVAYALYLPHASEPAGGRGTTNAYAGTNATRAAYCVVARLDGTLVSVVEAVDWDAGPSSTHVDALKAVAPDTLLLNSNEWATESGRAYAWRWTRGAGGVARFNDAVVSSSHDVQMAYAPEGEESASYWVPATTRLRRIDRASGAVLETHAFVGDDDMNHAQLIEEDARALLSFRLTNGVKMYDVEAREALWTAGGSEGTLDVVDLDGSRRGPHATLWRGQHNAEWFGADTGFYAFDNQYETDNASRLIRVVVDEDARTATLAWDYRMHDASPVGQSPEFGDADLLPNDNVLATWWPSRLAPGDGVDFDAQIVEVTPDKEVAWSMSFVNTGSFDKHNDPTFRKISLGWKLYSAERFYAGPFVSGASVSAAGGLRFTASSTFKRQNPSRATWSVRDDDAGADVAAGTFDFPAYWRGADVDASLARAPAPGAKLTLTVADEFGASSSAALAPPTRRR